MGDEGKPKIGQKLSPYNPTHDKVLLEAVALLLGSSGSGANPSDRTAVVYDFGCGDGRFLVAAAKQPSVSKVVGIEYDEELVRRAQQRIAEAALGNDAAAVEIRHADLRTQAAADATHGYAYLTPDGMAALVRAVFQPLLQRGGRLVTYVFTVPGMLPTRVWRWNAVALYLYTRESLPE